jgi:hypothetical protein
MTLKSINIFQEYAHANVVLHLMVYKNVIVWTTALIYGHHKSFKACCLFARVIVPRYYWFLRLKR